MSILIRLLEDARGLTSTEYGLVAALVATAIVVGLGFLGEQVAASYEETASGIRTAVGLD
ncbi:MAG: Flp family type IVb pilin [Rhodospirillales bacterium]